LIWDLELEESRFREKEVLDEALIAQYQLERRRAAENYARLGLHVVRLYGLTLLPDGQIICDCDKARACQTPGKHPNHDAGFMDVPPPTVEQVMEWWDVYPNGNVGLLTGKDWGFVLDLDLPRKSNSSNGVEVWNALVERHGGAPETRVAITGSGGMHWWFLLPEGRTYEDDLVLGKKHGIDVKKTRGLVVTPPSLHQSGNLYRWENHHEPVIAPEWLFTYSSSMSGSAKQTLGRKGKVPANRYARARQVWTDDQRRCGLELLDRINPSLTIPPKMARKIKEGSPQRGSELLFDLCLEASRIGIGPDRLFSELMKPGSRGGGALRRRAKRLKSKKLQEWFIDNVYLMALHQIAESTSQIDHLIQLAKEFQFESFEIPESANDLVKVRPSNLRKVLLECLSIARTTATLKPFLSQVQIARATGLSTKTVMHALRYLEALGWMSTINKRDQHATQYELSIHILKL